MDVKPHRLGFGHWDCQDRGEQGHHHLELEVLTERKSQTRVASRRTQGWVGVSPPSAPSMANWLGFGEGELVAATSFCL
jgi:hypothetical protein